MKTQIYSLFSGSSGNCTLVRHGKTELLIDAGVSARAICASLRAVGSAPENISAIFITHEHIDHIKGLGVMSRKDGIPIYSTPGTIGAIAATSSLGEINRDYFNR